MKILTTIAVLLFATNFSFACLCYEFDTYDEFMEATDYIVSGSVIEKSYTTYYDTTFVDPTDTVAMYFAKDGMLIRDEKVIEIQVKVKTVYKGAITSDTITVFTATSSSACGDLRFKENQEYFILGYDRNYPEVIPNTPNMYWTSKCAGNSLFSEERKAVLNKYFGK
ncbi:MAG: hypothetical protein Crog4KO_06380 [Crocinitomicaceae bacterium]